MRTFGWLGSNHGDFCREKAFDTTCNHCGQYAYYWQCNHGCKVFFYLVPWIHGEWDATCPCID